jgi:C4-dicarboxylate transporter DctM subunit
MDIAIIVVLLVLLALLGSPLFAIFGAAAVVLFSRLPDTPLSGAANDMFSEKFADSPLLVTIPLFTFAGVLMAESGTPKRLVNVSRALFGFMPGGLAIVCLVASAIFTTFTGGSGITIVAIGGLLYPALIAERYPEEFSLGLVTTGGSLGLLFPPSLPIIIYGVVGGVDIESLFVAALVPGLATMAILATYASVHGVRKKIPRTPFDGRSAAKAVWEAKWEALLPVVLVGGLATGMLRIHEAAAFTALYVLVVETLVYKDLAIKEVPRIIRESVTLVGAILIILATAIGFTAFLIQANVPQTILAAMQTFITSKWTFLLVLNLFLLVVGMLMDIFSAIVVVVPLIVPIANHFGVNPYHLGAVFLLNLEIGYLTPPVGLNLFISSFRFNKPMSMVYRAVLPYIALLLLSLAVVTYVPYLSTWSSRLAPFTVPSDSPAAAERETEPDIAPTDEGSGDTLDDLEGSETLDDLEGGGETLDDLEPAPQEGETLDDLEPPPAEIAPPPPPAGMDAPTGREGEALPRE